MGTTVGRKVLASLGRTVRASATDDTEHKIAGITLDWSTVAAAGSDTTLPDGQLIAAGQKGLVFGTVLVKIAAGTIQTVTITGSPTGGSFTLGVNAKGSTQTTGAIASNANAAAVQAALEALSNVDVGDVTVTGTNPAFTVAFGGTLISVVVPAMAHTDSLTGGTSPAVAVAVTNVGQTTTNYYGPADTTATDGRQALGVGTTFVLDETVLENPPFGFTAHLTNHPPVIDGGTVWRKRLQVTGGATTPIAAHPPTLAQLLAVLPRLKVLEDA
jgi:hypothetical protein